MHQGSPIRQATFPGTPQKADGRFFGGSFHVLLGRRASAITLVPYKQTQDLPAGSWGEAPRLLGSELGIIAGGHWCAEHAIEDPGGLRPRGRADSVLLN
jgi:hypothetical protein